MSEPREEKQATCSVKFSMSTTSGKEGYEVWATSEATEADRDAAWTVGKRLRRAALAELGGPDA